jgi:hypothetical protein
MTNAPTNLHPSVKIIVRVLQGVFYSIAIILGCFSIYGFFFNPTDAAKKQIKENLRSPSSFKEIKNSTLWEGKDDQGRNAFIIKIEYEAMNGFGGINRECKYFAISRKFTTFYWSDLHSQMTCMEPENEDYGVQLLTELNNYKK